MRPLSAETRNQLGLGDPVPGPGLTQSRLSVAAVDKLDEDETLINGLKNVESWLVELLDTLGYDLEFA
jgi:hypothetical protein